MARISLFHCHLPEHIGISEYVNYYHDMERVEGLSSSSYKSVRYGVEQHFRF